MVGFFAADPARASAFLRLPMIVLIAVLVFFGRVEHWLPGAYEAVLVSYAVLAATWLWTVWRRPAPNWATAASVGVDVVAVVALCVVSGGATPWLLPVFFLLPIALAFQESPRLTAAISLTAAIGYLVCWIVHSRREPDVELAAAVYLQFGFLVWFAVAITLLSAVLARRTARVTALTNARRELLSESQRAEEAQRRELAEYVHDGPLQNLLAAALDVGELRERRADPELETLEATLRQTATQLRGTVSALHPQTLAELGLTSALRELLRDFEQRARIDVEAELDDVGRPYSEALLYRAARELLANIYKHARATTVRVRLASSEDSVILTVADDGAGLDPQDLSGSVAGGHIGLASLAVHVDAVGGSLRFDRPTGGGTCVTITVPLEAG